MEKTWTNQEAMENLVYFGREYSLCPQNHVIICPAIIGSCEGYKGEDGVEEPSFNMEAVEKKRMFDMFGGVDAYPGRRDGCLTPKTSFAEAEMRAPHSQDLLFSLWLISYT